MAQYCQLLISLQNCLKTPKLILVLFKLSMCLIIYFKVDKIGFKNMYSNILGTVDCKKNGNCQNKFSLKRIFIKDYKVSVSIWHIKSESRVTFEMPQLFDLQKCVWLRDGVSIRAIAREINVDNVWVTFWETSLSIPFTKPKVWRCQSVWVFNGRNCTNVKQAIFN
jgi:hypothetical protein